MLNGELKVFGTPASQVDLTQFSNAEDMTEWEMAAYTAYDTVYAAKGRCDAEHIETLADLFGQEFSDAFFTHKNRLIRDWELAEARTAALGAIQWYKKVRDYVPGPNLAYHADQSQIDNGDNPAPISNDGAFPKPAGL